MKRTEIPGTFSSLLLVEKKVICCSSGEPETLNHLFLQCSFANLLWCEAKIWQGVSFPIPEDPLSWLSFWRNNIAKKAWRTVFFSIIDGIWYVRNKAIFQSTQWSANQETMLVKLKAIFWIKARGKNLTMTSLEMMSNIDVLLNWQHQKRLHKINSSRY